MAVLGLLLYRTEVFGKRVLCLLRATAPHEEDFSVLILSSYDLTVEKAIELVESLRLLHPTYPPTHQANGSEKPTRQALRLGLIVSQNIEQYIEAIVSEQV